MKILSIAAIGLGSPALAASLLTVENCQMETPQRSVMSSLKSHCDLTNNYERTIANVEYGIRYLQEGREVPWAEDGYKTYRLGTDIPGGIAPQETVPVKFWGPDIPDRAPADLLRVIVEVTRVTFASGEQVIINDTTESALKDVQDALSEALKEALKSD
jgi:hypothetical protein